MSNSSLSSPGLWHLSTQVCTATLHMQPSHGMPDNQSGSTSLRDPFEQIQLQRLT